MLFITVRLFTGIYAEFTEIWEVTCEESKQHIFLYDGECMKSMTGGTSRKIVLVLIALPLLEVIILTWHLSAGSAGDEHHPTLLNVPVCTQTEIADACRGRTIAENPVLYVGKILFDGIPAAYDAETQCCYITQNTDTESFEGNLESQDGGITLMWEEDAAITDKAYSIRYGHRVKLYILTEKEYSVCNVIFTGLPVITVNDTLDKAAPDADDGYAPAQMSFCFYPEKSWKEHAATSCGEYRISKSGETLSFRLLSDDGRARRKENLMDLGSNCEWKLYSISDTDDSRVRSAISLQIWNIVCSDDRLHEECRYAVYFHNDNLEGLRLMQPHIDESQEQLCGFHVSVIKADKAGPQQILGAVNSAEYLLFLQIADAVDNISDDYYQIYWSDENQYSVMPGRLEYSLGTFPHRWEYMTYHAASRMIAQDTYSGDIGMDFGSYLAETRERWSQIRGTSLTDDKLISCVKERSDWLSERGGAAMFDEEEQDEIRTDTMVLESYLKKRLHCLDLYYGTEEESTSLAMDTEEETGPDYLDILASVDGNGNTPSQNIRLLHKDQNCYLLLPSYCVTTETTLTFNEAQYRILWNGLNVRSGERIAFIDGNTDQTLRVENILTGKADTYSFHVLRAANLATVYIETANHTTDWMDEDKNRKEPGTFLCISSSGETDSAGSIRSMHARGHSTFEYGGQGVKHSYHLTLERETDILSMGSARKWILQSNNHDALKIRNAAAMDLARELGCRYVPDYSYADVYLNGEYAGNYLIMEQIETDQNRLDIPEDGSALLSLDYHSETVPVISTKENDFNILYPKEPDDDQKAGLLQQMEHLEELIRRCEDPKVYRQLEQEADTDSFVRMYLMDFLTNETDSNLYSTYYYIDGRDGRLHAGPVWDYDRALGNDSYGRGVQKGLNAYFDGYPEQMAENTAFTDRIRELWEREDWYQWITKDCSRLYGQNQNSQNMDQLVWGYVTWSDCGGIEGEIERFGLQLKERCSLLDGILNCRDKYCRVQMHQNAPDEHARTFWAQKGQKMPQEVIDNYLSMYYLQGIYTADNTEFSADSDSEDRKNAEITADFVIREDMETYGIPLSDISSASCGEEGLGSGDADVVNDSGSGTAGTGNGSGL